MVGFSRVHFHSLCMYSTSNYMRIYNIYVYTIYKIYVEYVERTGCMTYCGNYHENLQRPGFATDKCTQKKNLVTRQTRKWLVFVESCERKRFDTNGRGQRKFQCATGTAALGPYRCTDKLNNRSSIYQIYLFAARCTKNITAIKHMYVIYY